MLGLKLLLGTIGGVAGVTGLTAFSFQDWDPSHVWRLENKNEFYLTTCRSRRREDDTRGSKWIHSDLSVYLTFEKGVSTVTDGTELKLIGKGYYQKFTDTTPISEIEYKDYEDLHQKIGGGNEESRFQWTFNRETKNNWLGEGGGGVDSSRWGELIMCDKGKKIFKFNNLDEQLKSANLSQITFSLYDCGKRDYKGVKGCSIKIADKEGGVVVGHQKGLRWEENFQPIVISSSIS